MRIKAITFIIILISFFMSQMPSGAECPANNLDNFENLLLAQVDDAEPPFGPRGQFQKGKGKNFKRFEKFRQRKLMELLELNDDQKEKLQPMMEKMRNHGHQLISDKIELTDNLTAELKQKSPDELKINEYINKILVLNEKHERMRSKLHSNVKQFLTPVQYGKLIIFEERFHQRAMEKVFDEHRRMEFKPDSGNTKRGRNK